jgi:hypothetical protein
LLQGTEQSRFAAEALVKSLEEFIAAVIAWMPQYQFEPHSVELAFGIEEKPLPAWEIDLGEASVRIREIQEPKGFWRQRQR